MLDLVMTTQYRKDLKRINKRGKDLSLLKDVLQTSGKNKHWKKSTVTTP